jgi:hypothetical protein
VASGTEASAQPRAPLSRERVIVEVVDEILDGMVDVVFGEIELPSTDADWKTALRGRAASARDALRRHP